MTPKWFTCLAAAILLSGCGETEQTTPTYQVERQPFELMVPVKGELEAASATAIGASSRRPMTIAWLEKEYTNVKKGQLIARFDAEQLMRIRVPCKFDNSKISSSDGFFYFIETNSQRGI